MRTFALVVAALALLPSAARGAEGAVTPKDVLELMARIPASSHPERPEGQRPGGWHRIGIAGELADAIAQVAPDRTWAARMAVYAAFESGNKRCAVGDGGKSLGPFQMQNTPEEVACDPLPAAKRWLSLAKWAEGACKGLPDDERFAALVSGRCDRGHQLSRRREEVIARVLRPLPEE